MKTNYSGVLMILSTIVLSACGSSTQGAGANADGSCNDSVKGAAQTLVSSLGTAQTNLLNDQNPDGTYSYYWNPTQGLTGIKGNFMVVLTTSTGQTVTSQSFQVPNNLGGLIPGWCIQSATLKASVCRQQ